MSPTRTDSPARHLVVGVDYSELSRRALLAALDIAAHHAVAQVHIVAVARGLGPHVPDGADEQAREAFRAGAQLSLEAFVEAQVVGLGIESIHQRVFTSVAFGEPAVNILALAERLQAELIVVGTHGRKGLELLTLGSVAEEVLRGAHCPVLVMKPKETAS